jgi:hypothetical protein
MNARVVLSQSDSSDIKPANSTRSLGLESERHEGGWQGPRVGYFFFNWIATESGLAELSDSTAALAASAVTDTDFGSGFAAADVYARGLIPALLHRAGEHDLAQVLASAALLADAQSVERAIAILCSLTYLVDDELSNVLVPMIDAMELLVVAPFGSEAASQVATNQISRKRFAQHLADTLHAAECVVAQLRATTFAPIAAQRELALR